MSDIQTIFTWEYVKKKTRHVYVEYTEKINTVVKCKNLGSASIAVHK